jgi:hypothetical protein
MFSVDIRALAVFRIFLGLLLLLDLFLKSRSLVAFYTDNGVLPRAVHAQVFPILNAISLHTLSGSVVFQIVIFLIAGVFAVFLILGYRTKLSIVCSFLMLLSLQARAPVVLNGGDTILTSLVFFGIFLPLGKLWSIDGVNREAKAELVSGIRPAAPIIYIVFMIFWVNGLLKLQGGRVWLSGEAVTHVFGIDSLTVFLGDLLTTYPELLTVVGWLWLSMLVLSPLLILLPGWYRVGFVSAFIMAEVGMLLTLRLGLFPLVLISGLVLFLPTEFWDFASDGLNTPLRHDNLGIFEELAYTDRELSMPDEVSRLLNILGTIVVSLIIIVGLVWAFLGTSVVDAPSENKVLSQIDGYIWTMFAPTPHGADGWYVAPARLESGKRIDAYGLSEVSWDRPPDIESTYPTVSWYNYLYFNTQVRLSSASQSVRNSFAGYLCSRAQGEYDERVEELSVYYIEYNGETTEKSLLASTDC